LIFSSISSTRSIMKCEPDPIDIILLVFGGYVIAFAVFLLFLFIDDLIRFFGLR
jgi:hypothetical protein